MIFLEQLHLPTTSRAAKSQMWGCKHLGRCWSQQGNVLFSGIVLSNNSKESYLWQWVYNTILIHFINLSITFYLFWFLHIGSLLLLTLWCTSNHFRRYCRMGSTSENRKFIVKDLSSEIYWFIILGLFFTLHSYSLLQVGLLWCKQFEAERSNIWDLAYCTCLVSDAQSFGIFQKLACTKLVVLWDWLD